MNADTRGTISVLLFLLLVCSDLASAHDGPPYPIISNQWLGPYRVSVWTDPDTTDDGTPGGQFWVMIESATPRTTLSPDVRAQVTVRPLDRRGAAVSGHTMPVDGDLGRQFVALTMDHEGRFAVRVEVAGTTGRAGADAEVLATYDSRPSRLVLAFYLVPFLLVSFLWTTLLVRRRRAHARLTK